MKGLFFSFIILAGLAAAPNALWLMGSTMRVTNEAGVRLRRVSVQIDDQANIVGNIQPASTRFTFLPTAFGGAMLTITYKVKNDPASGCQEYVESTGYHVEVVVREDRSVQCSVEQPLTSALLIQKML